MLDEKGPHRCFISVPQRRQHLPCFRLMFSNELRRLLFHNVEEEVFLLGLQLEELQILVQLVEQRFEHSANNELLRFAQSLVQRHLANLGREQRIVGPDIAGIVQAFLLRLLGQLPALLLRRFNRSLPALPCHLVLRHARRLDLEGIRIRGSGRRSSYDSPANRRERPSRNLSRVPGCR